MRPVPDDDDRRRIIDAAYSCLSEPHSGSVPVAAILQRAGVSTRAFYRHFQSKDELYLAMMRQETDALADRLERIVAKTLEDTDSDPVEQLRAWIDVMFALIHDDQTREHFTVIDSDEVRAAKGYREAREKAHAGRERSLLQILRHGRDDGSFPLTEPEYDAMAINALISRVMAGQRLDDPAVEQRAKDTVVGFALRALGAVGASGVR